jgi:hypothetical protein
MWTKENSGRKVNWSEAKAYCSSLAAGGNHDWRLPTIDELQHLFDVRKTKREILAMDYSVWSSTKDTGPSYGLDIGKDGMVFFFSFCTRNCPGGGKRSSTPVDPSYGGLTNRILCVRRSTE